MAEDREVEVRDTTAGLEELRRIGTVEGEEILRPFSESTPEFFVKLAEGLEGTMRRYSEIVGIEMQGGVDPEEGYVYLGVGLIMSASVERACEIMDALPDVWLHDLSLQAPLELEVVARPA